MSGLGEMSGIMGGRFSSKINRQLSARLDPLSRTLSKTLAVYVEAKPSLREDVASSAALPLNLGSFPMDFTLKTKLRITAVESLDWACAPNAMTIATAIRQFAGGEHDERTDEVTF